MIDLAHEYPKRILDNFFYRGPVGESYWIEIEDACQSR
ncbi:hypothetical protein FB004_103200 [Sinorhizobium medicae]|nr:hypothetical protein FB004_103200 [Sinorhizobium medicae]TWA28351.1 hypothetical protein FB007_12233 [Sinorhizobium medicae]